MKIIGLVGVIGAGKGTVADMLVEHGYSKISFADTLKDMCAILFGWPRHLLEGDTKESREWREQTDDWWSAKLNIPDFTPRLALQLIGTDALRNHFSKDIWILALERKLSSMPDDARVVIPDVRFINEFTLLHSLGGKIVEVRGDERPVWYYTALSANTGSSQHERIMRTTYGHVHASEWAWVGGRVDGTIINDSTLASLEQTVLMALLTWLN